MAKRKTLIRGAILCILVVVIFAMFRGKPPNNLGVHDGQMAACPDKPNCVSTQATQAPWRIEPLQLTTNVSRAKEATLKILTAVPRTKVVIEEANYLRAECTTALMRFVDDVEIWIDEENGLVQARSASRVGYSDLGVNRKRVEMIFQQLVEEGVASH